MFSLIGHPNYVYLRHQRRWTFSRLFAPGLHSRCVTSLSSSRAFIFPVQLTVCDWRVLCDWGVYFFIFRASLEGHANNAHCLAAAVNTVLCALFALAGRRDTEERLKEFLAVNWFMIISSYQIGVNLILTILLVGIVKLITPWPRNGQRGYSQSRINLFVAGFGNNLITIPNTYNLLTYFNYRSFKIHLILRWICSNLAFRMHFFASRIKLSIDLTMSMCETCRTSIGQCRNLFYFQIFLSELSWTSIMPIYHPWPIPFPS